MYKKIFFLAITLPTLLLAKSDLTVGTNAEYAPFCFIENDEIVGFDIDIAKEVSKRLGKTITWKDMPFDALIPDLVMGNVDFVAAGLSVTEERAKQTFFTKPYHIGDSLVILSKVGLEEKDLAGKTIVTVEGFTADVELSKREDIHLIRLLNQADATLALITNRADAFVTSKTTAELFLKTQAKDIYKVTSFNADSDSCALAIPKSKKELLVQIQKALDEMQQDGTIDNLKTKWGLS